MLGYRLQKRSQVQDSSQRHNGINPSGPCSRSHATTTAGAADGDLGRTEVRQCLVPTAEKVSGSLPPRLLSPHPPSQTTQI